MDLGGNASTCCSWKVREPEFVVRNVAAISYVVLTGFCGEPVVAIFLHIFMLTMFLLSLVLNLLVIAVLVYRKVENPMHLFLLNLAFADLLGATAALLTTFPTLLTKTSYIPDEVCLAQVFLVYLFGGAFSGIVTTMAMDRYVAICNPLMYHVIFYRKRNINILALTWTGAFIMAATYTGLCIQMVSEPLVIRSYVCDHLSITNALKPSSSFNLLFNVIIIFVIIMICFCCQYYTYRKIFQEIKMVQGKALASNSKKKLAQHLLLPISTYIIGLVMFSTCIADHFVCHPLITNMKVISQVVYYSAVPALNPIIYGLRMPEIRKYIVHSLKNCDTLICQLLHL